MSRYEEAQAVLQNADCLHDAAAVGAAYDRLARAVRAEYGQLDPLLLCTMIGGLVPTAELIKRLNFPFELDYLHATRYRGETVGAGLVWKAEPSTPLEGRHVLVIDDILDEGHTLAAIQSAILGQRPASLKTVVLAEKLHKRKAPGVKAEFIGLTVPDRYVFGCGMDYKEYLRHLPAIYAVRLAGAST
ncbi:hypoxanthine-guanine phosphoribosyltransferase [Flagellatimonas centrodinii]|uniref:hypoxanthine-guanine phosphoribosyltransferase n=1 Tax=Flagellatimonas centrodinii TaxID=2806210 RepID=UPI001FEE5977|nr:hypoxanthine-guanine phosphoribosyltransferase [Flagellatimonas centrodinii]ULQ46561.1 hypoxanthine-guanine phosphoribosyltransferase [Flagellatimonas centrodinii]